MSGGERVRKGWLGVEPVLEGVGRAQGSGVCSRLGAVRKRVYVVDRAVLFTKEPGETVAVVCQAGGGLLTWGWMFPPLLGCDEGVLALCSVPSPSQDVLI